VLGDYCAFPHSNLRAEHFNKPGASRNTETKEMRSPIFIIVRHIPRVDTYLGISGVLVCLRVPPKAQARSMRYLPTLSVHESSLLHTQLHQAGHIRPLHVQPTLSTCSSALIAPSELGRVHQDPRRAYDVEDIVARLSWTSRRRCRLLPRIRGSLAD
jgi:hypothetical protein